MSGRNNGERRWAVKLPMALCGAYAVLLLAWGAGNGPFAAPDEWSHYLRAIGVGAGDPIGEPYVYPVAADAPREVKLSYAWINQASRLVEVPAGLYAEGLDCNAGNGALSAACHATITPTPVETVQPTPVGNYQPLPYLLPGLLVHLGDDPFVGNVLGRLGAGLVCLALLGVAVWILWDGVATSLAGLLAAVSPMVLFIGASLTPSSTEIAAGIAFAAALIRLWRDASPGRGTWLALGATGAIRALSRSTGPLWIGLDLLIFAALTGPRGARIRLRDSPRPATMALALLTIGVALSLLWERLYGSKLAVDPAAIWARVPAALARLPLLLVEEIGVFGPLDTLLPRPIYLCWVVLLALPPAGALVVGSGRERAVLTGTVAGGLGVSAAISAAFTAGTGFDVQGRHLLPFVVMIPMLAGEIAHRGRVRLPAAAGLLGFAAIGAIAAAVHLMAWYWNARRHGVGSAGPLWFPPVAAWSPPLGWWPWLLATVVGSALLPLLAAWAVVDAVPGRTVRTENGGA